MFFFIFNYNNKCVIKEIIGSVMIVLIKKIINNLLMFIGIFELSMMLFILDKYINCDILSVLIIKWVILFCIFLINIEGKNILVKLIIIVWEVCVVLGICINFKNGIKGLFNMIKKGV